MKITRILLARLFLFGFLFLTAKEDLPRKAYAIIRLNDSLDAFLLFYFILVGFLS